MQLARVKQSRFSVLRPHPDDDAEIVALHIDRHITPVFLIPWLFHGKSTRQIDLFALELPHIPELTQPLAYKLRERRVIAQLACVFGLEELARDRVPCDPWHRQSIPVVTLDARVWCRVLILVKSAVRDLPAHLWFVL